MVRKLAVREPNFWALAPEVGIGEHFGGLSRETTAQERAVAQDEDQSRGILGKRAEQRNLGAEGAPWSPAGSKTGMGKLLS